jgi:ABC-type multidrug transport system fused ATPase/permease subunit
LANERLSAIKLIKISNTVEQEKQNYFKALRNYYTTSQQASYYQALNFGILDGAGQFSLISVLLYGCFLISHGIGSPEMLTASIYSIYIGLGFRYFMYDRSMMVVHTELTKVCGLYEGIRDILGEIKPGDHYNHPDLFDNLDNLAVEAYN